MSLKLSLSHSQCQELTQYLPASVQINLVQESSDIALGDCLLEGRTPPVTIADFEQLRDAPELLVILLQHQPNLPEKLKSVLKPGDLVLHVHTQPIDTEAECLHFVGRWQAESSNVSATLFYIPHIRFQSPPENSPTPTQNEWDEMWKAWDYLTRTLIQSNMLLEKPISLRHPFIFYLGHIPAFLDIQLTNHLKEELTEPKEFAKHFERGIDPDVDDPNQCHPHSEIPDEWPSLEKIWAYQERVRARLSEVLNRPLNTRLGRVLSYAFEHQAMHFETLLYMLIRCQTIGPIKSAIPQIFNNPNQTSAPKATLQVIPEADVTLGLADDERTDHLTEFHPKLEFGWDNEAPERTERVTSFSVQSRPVTNGEYLEFVKATVNRDYPASWVAREELEFDFDVLTLHGKVPMTAAINWPVMASFDQATSYAAWAGMRLPSEGEIQRLRSHLEDNNTFPSPNWGLQAWQPREVRPVQLFGDGWEWTSSLFQAHPGFQPSELYPGYSRDFFDGKHRVILGGSWATHPRLAMRRTFRNWYHQSYPYMFATFRCCST